jgi:hypothetical protein
MASSFEPSMCEYEKVWETRCRVTSNTNAEENVILYRSYSCCLFFCPYSQRECRVKRGVK